MKTNQAGIDLIKSAEGFANGGKAYKLPGEDHFTIGYGHSFDDSITANTVWTREQAEAALKKDLEKFERSVDKYAKKYGFIFNENQYAALVSYCYNRGAGGLNQLLKNSKTIADVSKNIIVYWGSAERYKTGLLNRRNKEKALFDKQVETNDVATATETKTPIKWDGMELKPGQIGRVTILKPAELLKRNGGKLEKVRELNAGDVYRVYRYDEQYGGQYDVGAGHWIAKNGCVKFETPSKAMLEKVKA